MKKLITIIILALSVNVLASEPNEPNDMSLTKDNFIAVHLLGQPTENETDVECFIGYGKGRSEVGIVGGYTDNDAGRYASAGVYALYYLPDLRDLTEEILYPIEWLPPNVKAELAVGGKFKFNFEENRSFSGGPILGMKILKNLMIMYYRNFQTKDANHEDRESVGISAMWEF